MSIQQQQDIEPTQCAITGRRVLIVFNLGIPGIFLLTESTSCNKSSNINAYLLFSCSYRVLQYFLHIRVLPELCMHKVSQMVRSVVQQQNKRLPWSFRAFTCSCLQHCYSSMNVFNCAHVNLSIQVTRPLNSPNTRFLVNPIINSFSYIFIPSNSLYFRYSIEKKLWIHVRCVWESSIYIHDRCLCVWIGSTIQSSGILCSHCCSLCTSLYHTSFDGTRYDCN